MDSTDIFHFNKTEMFMKIRAGLPPGDRTRNFLESMDDLLFAWDAKNACLLVTNWRLAHSKNSKELSYQTLIPSSALYFEVERVLASSGGTLMAFAGPRGVALLELPRRCGKNGEFMNGKDKITCGTFNLDTLFFNNNPHLEIRQLCWHPASSTDSHLLVLLSDNTIRVYDNSTLRHVWRVGPCQLSSDVNPNSTTLTNTAALGEISVDFDIAPPVNIQDDIVNISNKMRRSNIFETTIITNKSKQNLKVDSTEVQKAKELIEWPIVILRENGNIYVLLAGLDTLNPRLQGPLTITPLTTANYGVDSCAILVIPSMPPTLVIAESNGKLHHALMVEAEIEEKSFSEIDASVNIYPSEWKVHVLETVELELGLSTEDTNFRNYNCAIFLKRDFINELRYFAYHNTGLHVITVNFIRGLENLVDNEMNSDITSLSNPATAEYIVCTKIDACGNINAVLGIVLLQMPNAVILLLNSGEVISLKLLVVPHMLTESNTVNKSAVHRSSKTELTLDEASCDSFFIEHINSILQRTVSQPILSLDKSAMLSPQKQHKLMSQTIEVLSTQYIKRFKLARTEFEKRISIINLRKEQQQRDIEELELERDCIREQAHRMAERFEEISDQQEIITKKCQDLMRLANTCLPHNPVTEKEFIQEVERINDKTKTIKITMDRIRENMSKYNYHISKYNEASKQKSFELPVKQEATIHKILLQLATKIESQIKETKQISKHIGI